MIFATNRRTAIRDTLVTVMLISVLWLLPIPSPAGELSEVSAILPPSLSLVDLMGRQRSLNEFANKVLLVTFWASWCRPCIEELPSIQRLALEMHGKPFAVLGVNVGEGERRVRETTKRLEIDFPVLLDKDSTMLKKWGATVLPTAYVLDRSGRVRYIGRGPLEWDRIDIIDMLGKLAE